MNNDNSHENQSPSVSPQPLKPEKRPEDKQPEMSFYALKKELSSQAHLVHLDSFFSIDDLRNKFPEPNERVEVIWEWLAGEIIDCFWDDRYMSSLAMLDELILLSGFTISDKVRHHFNHRLMPNGGELSDCDEATPINRGKPEGADRSSELLA